mmetsp:Transcript_10209/g.10281  ORF Transcript_10209/g.10281 Transcript_10209/m.10281 type:complete len:174 (+) Transcript_10209:170-691(+)|eukprot:CAMPEP_0182428966 /NCGR_PEP_ID=MMETSP1167-20130531/25149_1 /TAXON_ID=2988 /ORGANISM="Mallomonas Sp, Strain CCMP3275" /LENGTH=173 /DNA_ID=CAMNT_0024612231 /DNA_START=117 /DNA_END=638 /DNA_ORIENTATION=+
MNAQPKSDSKRRGEHGQVKGSAKPPSVSGPKNLKDYMHPKEVSGKINENDKGSSNESDDGIALEDSAPFINSPSGKKNKNTLSKVAPKVNKDAGDVVMELVKSDGADEEKNTKLAADLKSFTFSYKFNEETDEVTAAQRKNLESKFTNAIMKVNIDANLSRATNNDVLRRARV